MQEVKSHTLAEINHRLLPMGILVYVKRMLVRWVCVFLSHVCKCCAYGFIGCVAREFCRQSTKIPTSDHRYASFYRQAKGLPTASAKSEGCDIPHFGTSLTVWRSYRAPKIGSAVAKGY